MGVMTDILQESVFEDTGQVVALATEDLWGNVWDIVDYVAYYYDDLWSEIEAYPAFVYEKEAAVTIAIEHMIFDEVVNDIHDDIYDKLSKTLSIEGNFWTFVLQTLGAAYDPIAQRYYLTTTGWVNTITTQVTDVQTAIDEVITPGLEKVNKRIDDLELEAGGVLPDIIEDILDRVEVLEASVGALTPELIQQIQDIAGKLDYIEDLVNDVVDTVLEAVEEELDQKIKEYVNPKIQAIQAEIDHINVRLNGVTDVLYNAVIDFIRFLLTGMKIPTDTIEQAVEDILGEVGTIIDEQTAALWAEIDKLENIIWELPDWWIDRLKKKLAL